jgi:hypothetical protein
VVPGNVLLELKKIYKIMREMAICENETEIRQHVLKIQ